MINHHIKNFNQMSVEDMKELKAEDKFTFGCTDGCMGSCCMLINIYLDPWDVETIARCLNMSGQQFIQEYCDYEIDNNSRWPYVRLKDAASGPCSFLMEDGKCSIYGARPRNCRTAPLGRAVRYNNDGESTVKEEKIFFIPPTDNCMGFGEGRDWTVHEWFLDADAYKYYEFSDIYTELINYSSEKLNGREWMLAGVSKMMNPFLYGPELLRAKLGVSEELVDYEEFYRRRMKALKAVLTDMAAGFGCGPLAEQAETVQMQGSSMMDRVRKILLAEE
ncbi:protein of unknown function UPF0153 [Desulfofarcimen acetoxidans DSM 771]|uniref:YkgJ family cysteine cluster protein n=1 Tax=Desulfofarcimen acetoxidans (strain ATCC 49208 / DSM 771 / KCTC 5769 / VKM B-1644 / 5575) TaxID=485916 RepID=C8VVV5_DESAS|nr:YkgJ family cysteine cluster protein [Desulfofarcimen acetoxidans]ACV64242.1 protein of unknown function UPF0153 [Desulfofarcimen acetoxidans DSM 771]